MLEARARYDTLPVALGLLACIFPLGFILGDIMLLTLSVALAFGLAALGVDFLLGYAGQPTMGQSAFIGIGAYVSTLAMTRLEMPFLLALPAAMLFSGILAWLLGFAAVRLQRLGFAIVTFMFSYVVFVLLGGRLLEPVIGSTGGVAVPYAEAFGFALASGPALFFMALASLALAVFLTGRFVRSRSGLALVTLKQSEAVAGVLGIDVQAAKRRAFAVSAVLAGLCGVFYAQAASFLTAESFDPLMAVAVFGMAAVGGLGTLAGGIIGALFYRLIPEFAGDLQHYQSILFAILMLLALILYRDGLYGLVERLLPRRRIASLATLSAPTMAALPRVARSAADPAAPELLGIDALTVAFGGVKALTGVSMSVREGSTHALIGANGAGKTTLLNCISGVVRPDAGEIRLDKLNLNGRPCHALRRLGIARTFQNPALSPDLTLLQNARMGLYASHRWSFWRDWCGGLATREAERVMNAAAADTLTLVGLPPERWSVPARDASFGEQKLVDLARAVAGADKLLLLDEPAAGLTGSEIDAMVRLIARLKASRRLTIILVSHHVHLVRDIADRVTVLDFGRVLAEGTPDEMVRDKRVVDAFFGEFHAVE
jgi:ABC-type branched-subunit amino acid transport system ATPase component/ABC-type branched-subunit amino acid transport system permease subunit